VRKSIKRENFFLNRRNDGAWMKIKIEHDKMSNKNKKIISFKFVFNNFEKPLLQKKYAHFAIAASQKQEIFIGISQSN
jgi:hypothetical protein